METLTFIRPERPPDWSDVHTATGAGRFATAKDAYLQVLEHFPFWTNAAMAARNLLMKPFGLRTEAPEPGGNMLAQLPASSDTRSHYEAGLEDKHLTFSIEITFEGDQIQIRTNIWFNHPLGRAYLAAVYVPHKVIVGTAARGLSKAAKA